MQEKEKSTKFYVLTEQAVPEVLLKVVEAKKLVETGREESVQKAGRRRRR